MSTQTERCFSRKSSGRYGHGIRLGSGLTFTHYDYDTGRGPSGLNAGMQDLTPHSYSGRLFCEASGGKGLEGDLRAPGQDEIGDGAPHGRAVQDALAAGARRHVGVLEARHAAEHE